MERRAAVFVRIVDREALCRSGVLQQRCHHLHPSFFSRHHQRRAPPQAALYAACLAMLIEQLLDVVQVTAARGTHQWGHRKLLTKRG
eukprot:2679736-Prymnesium_polylepis.1